MEQTIVQIEQRRRGFPLPPSNEKAPKKPTPSKGRSFLRVAQIQL